VINLPAVPLQKWVMITISRSGRRYDVFYNNELVSSSKTLNMIATTADRGKQTLVGSSRLSGYAALLNKYDTNVSSASVGGVYKSSSDTRGAPILASALPSIAGNAPQGSNTGYTLAGYGKIPSLCPSGSCLEPPATRPANPMYEWDTPYA
jgi:hypothetical protein